MTAPPASSQSASAWRTALAVAGSSAMLWLGIRLLLGRVDGTPPAQTVRRALPALVALLLLGAAVGSPSGQQALSFVFGSGLRDTALALQAGSEAAPSAWRLDRLLQALLARHGYVGVCAALGFGMFLAERGLIHVGLSRRGVQLGGLLLRLLLFGGLAIATWQPPSGEGWGRALPFVLFALLLGAAVWVSIGVAMLHGLVDLLAHEELGWRDSVRLAFARCLDFRSIASRGEFWAYVAFFALAWAMAHAWLRPWHLLLAALLALPLPALAAVRFNLETAVGRARAGRDAVRWQGATTLRAHAREEEKRRRRAAARLDRVRSAVTPRVMAVVAANRSTDTVLPAASERSTAVSRFNALTLGEMAGVAALAAMLVLEAVSGR